MQTSINLASQPYVNLQGIKQRWMIISAVVVGVTLLLGIWTGLALHRQKDLDTQIKTLRKNCDSLNGQIANVQQTLHDAKNVELIQQSEFLNNIIIEKSFYWTGVFEELETIMPRHVQLVQIQPQLNAKHELHMHLTVSGNREDNGVLDLLKKLEQSPNFEKPVLVSETYDTTKPGGLTSFLIDAIYVGGEKQLAKAMAAPTPESVEDKKEKTGDKKEKTEKKAEKHS